VLACALRQSISRIDVTLTYDDHFHHRGTRSMVRALENRTVEYVYEYRMQNG
jgi:hypothetical protein